MFTGIIEEIGSVTNIVNKSSYKRLTVRAKTVLENTQLGDSIAINGVCQTVTNLTKDSFSVDVLEQSLKKTNIGRLKVNSQVNLERAITLNRPFGGHFVLGHVQNIGLITGIKMLKENYYLSIKLPADVLQYVAPEGSICIDGVSLTVAKLDGMIITINVIPHTIFQAIIQNYKIGSEVNIEPDMLLKSVVSKKKIGLTKEKLLSWGY